MKTRLNNFYRSYKGKWLIAIFALCSFMFLLLVIDQIALTNKFIYEREMNRVNTVGMLLTIHIIDHLLIKDTAEVRKILSISRNEPDIDLVSVLDKNRRVLLSTDPKLEGRRNPYTETTIQTMKGRKIYRSFPLYGDSLDLGSVQIGYSLQNLLSHIYLSMFRKLGIEFVMFFIILFAAWNITSALLKPLFQMKDVSNKIAAGDFSIRAPATSHDIIGELGAALNNMAERLGDLTENMNDKISRATENLSKSNEVLRIKTLELETSNRKLMELDRLKSDFVSMVSHDLKTPLTSIIGFAKTLMTLDVSSEQRTKYLAIIEAEGKRLAQLIGEYLDISKIESGNFFIKKEPVDLASLVRDTVDSAAIRLPPDGFSIILPPDGTSIHGDGNQLKRVIINLLDNAIRYNPPGKAIGVSVEYGNDCVVVSVKDNGPGIRPGEEIKIFDKFYRTPDTINERTSGTGLGLAISKGIIKAHDGLIWVESEPGEGATFRFSIPVAGQTLTKA